MPRLFREVCGGGKTLIDPYSSISLGPRLELKSETNSEAGKPAVSEHVQHLYGVFLSRLKC